VIERSYDHALTSPNGRHAIIRNSDGRLGLIDLTSGTGRGYDDLDSSVRPAGWAADSNSFFIFRNGELPARVHRIDVESGKSERWMEVWPSHRSGVDSINSMRLSADGERYACSYPMIDATLYLAQGLA
jgi:hypothetical protein